MIDDAGKTGREWGAKSRLDPEPRRGGEYPRLQVQRLEPAGGGPHPRLIHRGLRLVREVGVRGRRGPQPDVRGGPILSVPETSSRGPHAAPGGQRRHREAGTCRHQVGTPPVPPPQAATSRGKGEGAIKPVRSIRRPLSTRRFLVHCTDGEGFGFLSKITNYFKLAPRFILCCQMVPQVVFLIPLVPPLKIVHPISITDPL